MYITFILCYPFMCLCCRSKWNSSSNDFNFSLQGWNQFPLSPNPSSKLEHKAQTLNILCIYSYMNLVQKFKGLQACCLQHCVVLRPVSMDVLLPCRTQLIKLNSRVAWRLKPSLVTAMSNLIHKINDIIINTFEFLKVSKTGLLWFDPCLQQQLLIWLN